jgi:hypothetical protein
MTDLKGTLLKETTNAYYIDYDGDKQWIPRSLVPYIRKEPEKDGVREIDFILETWKAKQLGWD